MKFLKNTIGFLSVFCMVPSVFAVTARPSIAMGSSVAAASRMPTLRVTSTNTSAGSSGSTVSNLLDNIECIDAYMECIESEDSCGIDFSECTTNVLFHAQMPDCISTLAQCNAQGINSLFGTSDTAALSNVAEYNDDGEIVRYTYPTDGSVMGQKIIAARIENMYDDQTCVKRYTNCLKRDDVCGENFELCSSTRSFKKQALNCDAHLSRCSMSGVRKMFGDNVKTKSMGGLLTDANGVALTIDQLSSVGGSIATLIDEGSDYVAANAVSSCYKKVDACIAGACKKNPLRCIEGTSIAAVQAAQGVSGGALGSDLADSGDTLTASQINRYLRTTCADEIGGLDACHITYFGKKPKASDLTNPEIVDEVFVMAHNDRKSILESKVQGLMQEFDTDAKDACRDTMMKCVMRSCGGGSGAACYSQVFSTAGENTINGKETYDEIARGCASVANTDPNCLYAYQDVAGGEYSYMYATEDAFSTLFPPKTSSSGDPIGLVAALDASLSTNYNTAAIENMRKQCQKVATSCVKSLCGPDYVNCYRNRTDIVSNLTDTGSAGFDKSMNKVGGVLDHTIVLGLCVGSIKNAEACEEHLAIQTTKLKAGETEVSGWGAVDSVTDGWYGAGASSTVTQDQVALVEDDKQICTNTNGVQGECNTMNDSGEIYDTPVMVSVGEYMQTRAANTLFADLIYDLEKEAQAKYNAKLTKQQNECLAANNGGIMGTDDMSSTYMWAKLTTKKVPEDYSSQGLKSTQFKASNDLYGSFCRVKVTIHSDDQNIMNALNGTLVTKKLDDKTKAVTYESTAINKDWATRYFAIGDTFVCGSWIPQQALMEIAEAVGQNARADKQATQKDLRGWMTALGAIGLGTGGAFLGDAIQDGNVFTGLLDNPKPNKTVVSDRDKCLSYLREAKADVSATKKKSSVENNVERALKLLGKYDVVYTTNSYDDKFSNWEAKFEDGKLIDPDNKATNEAKALKEAIGGLTDSCNEIAADDKDSDGNKDEPNWWQKHGGTLVGGVVSGVGGGLLGYYITDEVQNAKLDEEQQKAIEEFMTNVGSKIQCYIGPDMVGTYGQAIPTSME